MSSQAAGHGNYLLVRARINAGLTQEQLAEASGLSAKTIRRLEEKAHTPRPGTAKAIADQLGLKPTDLFDFPFPEAA